MRASLSSSPIPSCNESGRRADRSPSRSWCEPLDDPGLLLCGWCESGDTRTHVVGELFETERSYVESLKILIYKYMQPLKTPEYSGVVEPRFVDTIFYQIPEILGHHEIFLDVLEQRVSNWDNKQKVGDLFVDAFTQKNVIDTYTTFINNWKSAKNAIKEASRAKSSFARFLELNSREHKGKLSFDALLIMPVQRIPRYELLIKELLKHTPEDHPDYPSLVAGQQEVHHLAVQINQVEKEALQHLDPLQPSDLEKEQLMHSGIDLSQPDRDFIRHDVVLMPGGLGTQKERCLFLFSDVLLITSPTRHSRKSSLNSFAHNSLVCFEMSKFKLLTKVPLKNMEISKTSETGLKKLMKEIEKIEHDIALMNQIGQLVMKLNSHQQNLEDVVKDVSTGMAKLLNEKHNAESHFVTLELTVTTQEGTDNFTMQFSSPERRISWEDAFHEAKQNLAQLVEPYNPPEFLQPLPIRKTRAGLQFTCATATLGINQQGLRDVWVCNSDGYVGQVCVLSLLPEPTVMSCNGVCNARIITVASIPPASPIDSSDEDDDTESTGGSELKGYLKKNEIRIKPNQTPEDFQEEMDNRYPTMWLGTEDGSILVYNCSDNIRTKKNKIKVQLTYPILSIIYLDNKVFVSVANGEIHVYKKEPSGGWCTTDIQKIMIGTSSTPVTRMLAVAGKLWCGCQNIVHIVNIVALHTEYRLPISDDRTHTVHCMATSGLGVWISLSNNSNLKLYHATTYHCLLDLNVAPAVTKMLSGCDDIIRQHKSACLRVTALLTCKDLLWIGTSAGVLLVLPLPSLTPTSTTVEGTLNMSGLPYGHTGHVRFLTCVNLTPLTATIQPTTKEEAAAWTPASIAMMVISGGDGYEDFRNANLGEAAGRDDSTNHLLLWKVE